MSRFGFIGAGAMAEAIASGMIAGGICDGKDILMSNRSRDKLQRLESSLGICVADNNCRVMEDAEYIILAVKPQQLQTVAEELKDCKKSNQVLISILAGVTIETLEEAFGKGPVFRVMPNTPAKIGWGMTGIAVNDLATEEEKKTVTSMFEAVGQVIFFAEKDMDAVGAVSGCGPAFMYQIIEAMADGAVMAGLPRQTAYRLVAQTMAGSAMMLLESGEHPGALKDQVTSPGGTTIRGVKVMEDRGVRGAMMEAVQQAWLKSKELGEKK